MQWCPAASSKRGEFVHSRVDQIPATLTGLTHDVTVKTTGDVTGLVQQERLFILHCTKDIAWPDGVAPGKVLEQKHDIDLLHLQCNRPTQFLVNGE